MAPFWLAQETLPIWGLKSSSARISCCYSVKITTSSKKWEMVILNNREVCSSTRRSTRYSSIDNSERWMSNWSNTFKKCKVYKMTLRLFTLTSTLIWNAKMKWTEFSWTTMSCARDLWPQWLNVENSLAITQLWYTAKKFGISSRLKCQIQLWIQFTELGHIHTSICKSLDPLKEEMTHLITQICSLWKKMGKLPGMELLKAATLTLLTTQIQVSLWTKSLKQKTLLKNLLKQILTETSKTMLISEH